MIIAFHTTTEVLPKVLVVAALEGALVLLDGPALQDLEGPVVLVEDVEGPGVLVEDLEGPGLQDLEGSG